MRDKINNFLNCLIGAFIGVFLARSVYTYWDYKTHPELYAVSSAPWYTTILLFLINPVYPKWYHGEREKAKLGARIAGVLCILVGFLTRFIV